MTNGYTEKRTELEEGFLAAIIKGAIIDARRNLTPRQLIEEYMLGPDDIIQHVASRALPTGYPFK